MQYDKKFGNIELYLWQIRKTLSEEIRKSADLLGNYNRFDEYEFYCIAYRLMLKFMLRRLSRPGKTPIVDIDPIANVLYEKGIPFEASTSLYSVRRISSVLLAGTQISITTYSNSQYPLSLSASGEQYCYNWRLAAVSGSDLVDIIFLMEDLAPRLQSIVHEEYQGRIARTAANRIRRISARHRRMQGKDICNQESDEQYT